MLHPAPFWSDILLRPQDDAPRLRYAAWLDEQCDPLGEFIRVQCRLSRAGLAGDPLRELETRERELLAEFEEDWVGEIADMVGLWVFRRGFVREISASSEQFLEHAEELFRRAPIQEVHIGHVNGNLNSLAASSFLGKSNFLDLSNNPLRDCGARDLAASPHLAHLRGLNLSSSCMGDRGLKALAHSPYLNQLRELYLCDNRISSSGARALAASPLADRLGLLHLRFNVIGHDGADMLQKRFGSRVCL